MGINRLDPGSKREIYSRLIPPALLKRFNMPADFVDLLGNDLLSVRSKIGSPSVEITLRHQINFPDPVLYGHLTDTLTGQIHILLYILNDPDSPRFDVDRMPDGRPTVFGTRFRNIEAETAAMQAGLAPGQIRRGLRMLADAITSFEVFVRSLGQSHYFAEPLYYHNALLFEWYGFAYQKGQKLMERIHSGFSPGGDLYRRLDGSTAFRQPSFSRSIRLRSWAIHDGLLGEPFSNVSMYKQVGKSAGVNTIGNLNR
jgi:acetoin utilization protein AcuC